jgi:hypothetical protein
MPRLVPVEEIGPSAGSKTPPPIAVQEPASFIPAPNSSTDWNQTTITALAMLVILWAVKLYTTWGAWGSLTVDSGREMYVPWALAQGKQLYRDVWFPYGPAYCVCITVFNEGDRIREQLSRMKPRAGLADILIADGKSTDGSTDPRFLRGMGVRALLSTAETGLRTATRMGVAYAMQEGYSGIVTIDGNGRDGVEALPDFLAELRNGY